MTTHTRTFSFSDGTVAYGSQVESEIAALVSTWNNHESGASIFTSLKAALLTMSGNVVMAGNKVTGLGAATANGDGLRYEQGFIRQAPVISTSTTAFTTTNNTFTTSNCTASITPTSSSSRVLVLAQFDVTVALQNKNTYVTLARGTTNLLGSNGGSNPLTVTGGQVFFPASILFIDSPASTSSTTYNIRIQNTDGTTTVGIGIANVTQTMILVEII